MGETEWMVLACILFAVNLGLVLLIRGFRLELGRMHKRLTAVDIDRDEWRDRAWGYEQQVSNLKVELKRTIDGHYGPTNEEMEEIYRSLGIKE